MRAMITILVNQVFVCYSCGILWFDFSILFGWDQQINILYSKIGTFKLVRVRPSWVSKVTRISWDSWKTFMVMDIKKRLWSRYVNQICLAHIKWAWNNTRRHSYSGCISLNHPFSFVIYFVLMNLWWSKKH